MPLSKRDQTQIERRLAATLTEACETAKAGITGFAWLTHVVDYERFPSSLKIIWVFDTQANKDRALACGQDQYMRELTAQALEQCALALTPLPPHVHFDSEELCQRANAGNWSQRLARQYSPRG